MVAKKPKLSAFKLGLAVITGIAVVAMGIAYKKELSVALRSGETIKVHFAENYGVRAYDTPVKIAGIAVGDVTDVDGSETGATVDVKIDDDEYEKLRSRPYARVRPPTLLGGNYYLELVPGGQPGKFDGEIPEKRTEVPVELDKITRSLQPDTLKSVRADVKHLDQAFKGETRSALRKLLSDAPDTLRPAGEVLQSVRGTRPATDLPMVVRGLHNTAQTLTQQDGQVAEIVDDLATTSDVLGNRSPELQTSLRELPSTLDSTNAGLQRLDTTLGKLERTADPARPVTRELNSTLADIDPLLVKARPLVSKLDKALVDARPLVKDLTPTVKGTNRILKNLDGPVLDRVNGPVMKTVRSEWHGKGKYQGGGADFPFYKALAYALTGIAGGTAQLDENGNQFDIAITAGTGSIEGLPVNLESFFENLMGLTERGGK